MHENGGLEKIGVPLAADVCARNLPQVRIDKRNQLLEDGLVAVVPARQ